VLILFSMFMAVLLALSPPFQRLYPADHGEHQAAHVNLTHRLHGLVYWVLPFTILMLSGSFFISRILTQENMAGLLIGSGVLLLMGAIQMIFRRTESASRSMYYFSYLVFTLLFSLSYSGSTEELLLIWLISLSLAVFVFFTFLRWQHQKSCLTSLAILNSFQTFFGFILTAFSIDQILAGLHRYFS